MGRKRKSATADAPLAPETESYSGVGAERHTNAAMRLGRVVSCSLAVIERCAGAWQR